VAVLWNLWFFSFWSVQIVKEAAHSSLVAAGLTAAFNAGAGITGDLVPDDRRGSVFGIFNLVAEIGAVASPVVSGILRDTTGSWAPGVFVAAGVMAISVVLYALVRERVPSPAH
jgi:MFS family permease